MVPNRELSQELQDLIEQLAQIERHIKDQTIYTSFDLGKLSSYLAQYQVWAQANVGVIDAALSCAYARVGTVGASGR